MKVIVPLNRPASVEVGAFNGEESVAMLLDRVLRIAVDQAQGFAPSVVQLTSQLRLI